MKLFGTILNGQVQLDRPTDLPDGTRIVSLVGGELEDMEDFGDFSGLEYPHPMAPYDPVKEAALIRERVAAVRAGGKTIPLDEAIEGIDEAIRNASRRN